MYRDFTKDEREKSQYQDTILLKQRKMVTDLWEVLYNNVVNPAASHLSEETSGGVSACRNFFPFCFSGVYDCWGTCMYPAALTDTILGLPATLSMKQYTCVLKVVMGLPWESFQILIICMVIACFFPFLCHYTLLMELKRKYLQFLLAEIKILFC